MYVTVCVLIIEKCVITMIFVITLLFLIVFGGWLFLVYIPDKNSNNNNIKKSPKIKNRKFNRKNQM